MNPMRNEIQIQNPNTPDLQKVLGSLQEINIIILNDEEKLFLKNNFEKTLEKSGNYDKAENCVSNACRIITYSFPLENQKNVKINFSLLNTKEIKDFSELKFFFESMKKSENFIIININFTYDELALNNDIFHFFHHLNLHKIKLVETKLFFTFPPEARKNVEMQLVDKKHQIIFFQEFLDKKYFRFCMVNELEESLLGDFFSSVLYKGISNIDEKKKQKKNLNLIRVRNPIYDTNSDAINNNNFNLNPNKSNNENNNFNINEIIDKANAFAKTNKKTIAKRKKNLKIFKIAKILRNKNNLNNNISLNASTNPNLESSDNPELLEKIGNNFSNKSTCAEGPTSRKSLLNNLNSSNNINLNLSSSELPYDAASADYCIFPNSLITISKEVFKFLTEKDSVNIKTLNDIIIAKISSAEKKSESLTEKNIQRRVYDAINVMNAIGLIKKEKSILKFQGKMNLKSFEKHKSSVDRLKEEIEKKKNEIKEKKEQLLTFHTKFFLLKKLCQKNSQDFYRKNAEDKITYPFILIKQDSSASFLIKQDDNNHKLCILSDKKLEIMDSDYICRSLLKNDINGLKLFVKKSINEELYQSIKKEHLIDLYFRSKEEPYEEVINITLDEEGEEQIENEHSSEPTNNNFSKKHNLNFFDNCNSEIQNKIEKYNEDYNCNVDCRNSYVYEGENNNYSNNSNFDIYKLHENSNPMNTGANSQINSNINYHNYSLYQSASANMNNDLKTGISMNPRIFENKKIFNSVCDDLNKRKISNNSNTSNNNRYPNIHLINNKGQENKNNEFKNIDIFLN